MHHLLRNIIDRALAAQNESDLCEALVQLATVLEKRKGKYRNHEKNIAIAEVEQEGLPRYLVGVEVTGTDEREIVQLVSRAPPNLKCHPTLLWAFGKSDSKRMIDHVVKCLRRCKTKPNHETMWQGLIALQNYVGPRGRHGTWTTRERDELLSLMRAFVSSPSRRIREAARTTLRWLEAAPE